MSVLFQIVTWVRGVIIIYRLHLTILALFGLSGAGIAYYKLHILPSRELENLAEAVECVYRELHDTGKIVSCGEHFSGATYPLDALPKLHLSERCGALKVDVTIDPNSKLATTPTSARFDTRLGKFEGGFNPPTRGNVPPDNDSGDSLSSYPSRFSLEGALFRIGESCYYWSSGSESRDLHHIDGPRPFGWANQEVKKYRVECIDGDKH